MSLSVILAPLLNPGEAGAVMHAGGLFTIATTLNQFARVTVTAIGVERKGRDSERAVEGALR